MIGIEICTREDYERIMTNILDCRLRIFQLEDRVKKLEHEKDSHPLNWYFARSRNGIDDDV